MTPKKADAADLEKIRKFFTECGDGCHISRLVVEVGGILHVATPLIRNELSPAEFEDAVNQAIVMASQYLDLRSKQIEAAKAEVGENARKQAVFAFASLISLTMTLEYHVLAARMGQAESKAIRIGRHTNN